LFFLVASMGGMSVAFGQDVYDLRLFESDVESSASAAFSSEDDSSWFSNGDFTYASTTSFEGSWFGFTWGPLSTRFAMGSSDGNYVFLKSMSFGDMLIGRGYELTGGTGSRYFVAGTASADAVDPDPDASSSAGDDSESNDLTEAEEDSDGTDTDVDALDETVPEPEEEESIEIQAEAEEVADALESLIDGN
jgi:hypothetical protein